MTKFKKVVTGLLLIAFMSMIFAADNPVMNKEYPEGVPDINAMTDAAFESFMVECLEKKNPHRETLYRFLKMYRPIELTRREFKFRQAMKMVEKDTIEARRWWAGFGGVIIALALLGGTMYMMFSAFSNGPW